VPVLTCVPIHKGAMRNTPLRRNGRHPMVARNRLVGLRRPSDTELSACTMMDSQRRFESLFLCNIYRIRFCMNDVMMVVNNVKGK
jgi:hypothetical protein